MHDICVLKYCVLNVKTNSYTVEHSLIRLMLIHVREVWATLLSSYICLQFHSGHPLG